MPAATTAQVPSWIVAYLDGYGVRYRMRFHRSEKRAVDAAEVEQVSGLWWGKVVVMTDDQRAVLFVMPAYAHVDIARARRLTGKPGLRVATSEEGRALFPSLPIGAVPPLPLWPYAELWMDPLLRHDGPLLFAAGTHHAAIEVDFADWLRVAQPKVGSFVESSFIGA